MFHFIIEMKSFEEYFFKRIFFGDFLNMVTDVCERHIFFLHHIFSICDHFTITLYNIYHFVHVVRNTLTYIMS